MLSLRTIRHVLALLSEVEMEDCPDQDDHPAKIYESFT
jgi:hypothetical protein